MWKIEFNEVAKADLLRLDKTVRSRILRFLTDRVAVHPEPHRIAEPLEGEFRGLHRFRIGDYRVVAHIRKNELTILILFMDHRSSVYKRRLPTGLDVAAEDEG